MVRGTGKFKQKRGGGRNFSKDMILDENGTAVSAARKRAEDAASDNSDNSEEESEEEESEEEEVDPTKDKPELSRTERRELKKKQAAEKLKANGGEDEDEDLINPNHVTKKLKISDLGAPQELSRKEREAKDKQDAKDRYWKLHVQGKTEQAKTDLARLAKIKAEREAAQAKRKAETEAKASEIAAKTKAQQGRR